MLLMQNKAEKTSKLHEKRNIEYHNENVVVKEKM